MLSSGLPLKVLGVTSRFTTFLQHSMRDWLAAFSRLGHRTRLFIEDHDHEICNGLGIAAACAEFQPDLVVVIDHYRSELSGIPPQVPTVMWVQDALPNMFRPEAGAAGAAGLCSGVCADEDAHEYGYPAESLHAGRRRVRRAACSVRDGSRRRSLAKYKCDVSFVSHASATAETILKAEIEPHRLAGRGRGFPRMFEQFRADYLQPGEFVTEPTRSAGSSTGLSVNTKTLGSPGAKSPS